MCCLKLLKETQIVFRKHPQVFYLVFQVCNTLNTHSKSVSGVDPTIYSAIIQYIGVNHAASQDFEPPGILAKVAPLSPTNRAAHVHFCRWFREGKIGGPQAYFRFLAEEFPGKIEQGLLQVGKGDILVDIQAFHLVKYAV